MSEAFPPWPTEVDPVRAWARRTPERTCFIERRTGRRWSWAEFDALGDGLAGRLAAAGVGEGDRVATLLGNRPEHVALLLATARLGAALVPLNWRLAPAELGPILGDASPGLVVTDQRFGEPARQAMGSRPVPVLDLDAEAGLDDGGDGGGDGRGGGVRVGSGALPERGFEPEAPAVILYTSGSTGRPKGAVLPHRQLFANAVATSRAWVLGPDDVGPITTPLFHTGGWNVFALPVWHVGGTVVLLDGFDPDDFLAALDQEGCTVALAVPTQLHMLLQSSRWSAPPRHFRYLVSGGAPCPAPLAAAVREAGWAFREGYGLTECGPNCFTQTVAQSAAAPGAVGWPIDHLEVQLGRPDGTLIHGPGRGELLLRGPQLFSGYLNDPVRTAEAFTADGRLRTGDVAERDAEGRYRIVGRIKEIFISGGENVYPGEIEAALLEHPAIAEVAVVAIPDPKWGEVGRAWIVLEPGAELQAVDLRKYARGRLAAYKVPKSVRFVEALPRLGSGKIDRSELAGRP